MQYGDHYEDQGVSLSRVWYAYLIVGAAVCAAYFLAPPGLGRSGLYNLIAASSVLAVVAGARLQPPGRSLPWYLLAASLTAYLLGEVTWTIYEDILGGIPFPSVGDVFYLLGYPLFAAALVCMIRLREPGRDRASLIDAATITTGAAILCWVYLMEPYAGDATLSLNERLLSVAYPLGDLMMLAVLVRLLVGAGGTHLGAYRLLAGGLVLFLLGDTIFALQTLSGTYDSGDPVDAAWMISYLFFGAAALHPSTPLLFVPGSGGGVRITWHRLALLAGAALVAPGVLALETVRGRFDNIPVVVAGSAVLFLLVILRLAGLLVRNEKAVLRERTLRTAGAELAASPERGSVYRATYRAALEIVQDRPGVRVWVVAHSGDGRPFVVAGEGEGRSLEMSKLPDAVPSGLLATGCSVLYGADATSLLDVLEGESTGSDTVLLCPLVAGERARGAILVADGTGFPEETRDGVEALGSQASLALEGVVLAEELHRAREEERFRSLVQNSSDIVAIVDEDARLLYESPAVERILGYAPDGHLGGDALARVHPEDAPGLREALAGLVASPGSVVNLDCRMRHADGSWRDMEMVCNNLLSHPAVRGVVINARDVTVRREVENHYRALVENVPAIVYIQSLEGEMTTLYDSPKVTDMLGYAPDTYARNPGYWMEVIHPDDRERVLEEEQRAAAARSGFRMEYRVLTADGRVRWVRDEATVVEGGARHPDRWQGFVFDITDRKALEGALEHQAFHDRLTGLPNRALFMDRLQHTLLRTERTGTHAAILFLDLDNFKVINDSLGHPVGDGLLVAVSERLKSCVRARDTVCRLGGDEFVVLLEDTDDTSQAIVTAQRVLDAFRESYLVGGRELFVAASIGIVLGSSEDVPEDLLRDADLAMYRAKRRGRARYEIFDRSMNEQALARLQLETELRRAIGNGEIHVHYQPKVSLRDSGRIVGMEALARWQHPERGLVLPDDFIPVAEETGLIFPLGLHVLEEACAQARRWNADRADAEALEMNVNLSARQFGRPDLVDDVARILDETGLEPANLVLEITESVIMGDVEAARGTFERLKALGVRVALDDFGTGYSSLSYLKGFPVDYLKIDRSFVSGIDENATDRGIVATVVELAHTLGLEAVAEGVETEEQLEQLRTLRCELAQGFFFHKPLPAAEVSSLLAARGPAQRADPVL